MGYWVELPQSSNDEINKIGDIRAPSRSVTEAIGFDKHNNDEIEYLIVGSTGGMSNESGEMLWQYFVEKRITHYLDKDYSFYSHSTYNTTKLCVYVNKEGFAYRSWKGKLKGHPICNFHTGKVFKYIRRHNNETIHIQIKIK